MAKEAQKVYVPPVEITPIHDTAQKQAHAVETAKSASAMTVPKKIGEEASKLFLAQAVSVDRKLGEIVRAAPVYQ